MNTCPRCEGQATHLVIVEDSRGLAAIAYCGRHAEVVAGGLPVIDMRPYWADLPPPVPGIDQPPYED